MDEINYIANAMDIQNTRISPLCLGKASEKVDGKPDVNTVYFVVMSAPKLVEIRKEVFKLYVKKGGDGALFQPEAIWPHVTVGFTYRDMFIQDGVYKGLNSCIGRIELVDPPPSGDDSDDGDDGGDNGGDNGDGVEIDIGVN